MKRHLLILAAIGLAIAIAAARAQNVSVTNAVPGGIYSTNGALKGNGAGVVSQAACADLSNGSGACAQTYTATTWTPAVTTDGTVGTPVYSTQVGSYEQIGRLVIARFTIQLSSWGGSPTGNVSISGLPVASANVAGDSGGCYVPFYSVTGLSASTVGIQGRIIPNSTSVAINSNSGTVSTAITAAQFGATAILQGVCIYHS